jgi:hypothetical protein
LSALSVLAELQGGRLVRRLFPGGQGPGCNRHGAYVVKLCNGGRWQHVLVRTQHLAGGAQPAALKK